MYESKRLGNNLSKIDAVISVVLAFPPKWPKRPYFCQDVKSVSSHACGNKTGFFWPAIATIYSPKTGIFNKTSEHFPTIDKQNHDLFLIIVASPNHTKHYHEIKLITELKEIEEVQHQ